MLPASLHSLLSGDGNLCGWGGGAVRKNQSQIRGHSYSPSPVRGLHLSSSDDPSHFTALTSALLAHDLLDTCLYSLNSRYSPDGNVLKNILQSSLRKHREADGIFSASCTPLPRTPTLNPERGLGSVPTFPHLPPCTSRGERGVVEARRWGEAGSAPIWRAAVAGEQGAEGTCVTSFSLLSLLPGPAGPCPPPGGALRPRLQMGDEDEEKAVPFKKWGSGWGGNRGDVGKPAGSGNFSPREGNPDPQPSFLRG